MGISNFFWILVSVLFSHKTHKTYLLSSRLVNRLAPASLRVIDYVESEICENLSGLCSHTRFASLRGTKQSKRQT